MTLRVGKIWWLLWLAMSHISHGCVLSRGSWEFHYVLLCLSEKFPPAACKNIVFGFFCNAPSDMFDILSLLCIHTSSYVWMRPTRMHSFVIRFGELQPQEAKHLSQYEVGGGCNVKRLVSFCMHRDVTRVSEKGCYDTPPTPTFKPVNLCIF